MIPATQTHTLADTLFPASAESNKWMRNVLLAVGARFDDRVTGNIEKFCPNARIIHIDIDPASISKNVKVDIPIVVWNSP